MIELIHKYPILIKTLLAIVTLAFVAGGGLIMGSQPTEDWVAKVDGEVIPVSEYQQLVSRYEDFYRDLYQGEIPPELRAQLGLEEMALNELIDRRVILFTLDDMGITIGDKQVSETITANPSFADESGRFSKALYLELLRAYAMSPKDYEESVRRDLAVAMFRDMIKESAAVSDTEALAFYKEQMGAVNAEFGQDNFDEQKSSLKRSIGSQKESAMLASMMVDLRKNFDIEKKGIYGGKKSEDPVAVPGPAEAQQPQQGGSAPDDQAEAD
jgi:peptidyl-prolyl cis-trans isomerase D